MMHALRLYFQYLWASIRSQIQYKASFAMMVAGHFLVTGIEIFSIVALFSRFKGLAGWSLSEVALFYGIVQVAFACAEGLARGFDIFEWRVRNGDFDRVLLRPLSTSFQVAAGEVQIMRIGRLLQGLIVLAWAVHNLQQPFGLMEGLLILFSVLGGACMFAGLFVLAATMAFWTVQSLEIVNTVTYGGCETGQFPLSIYKPGFRRFFTFVVPLGCVTYFPALAILGRPDSVFHSPYWFQALAPCVGILFLLASLQVWKFGVRHYCSTGS